MKVCILNGYIVALSNRSGVSVSDEEFHAIETALANRPASESGCQAMLRADTLEWEQVEMPTTEEEHTDEISNDEIVSILLGGEE